MTDKARIRGEKLDELEMRAADIADSADGFRASAEELKCKFIREKWRLIAIISGVALVVVRVLRCQFTSFPSAPLIIHYVHLLRS